MVRRLDEEGVERATFFDRGDMVTPVYWGSHWPLARGKSTGWTIDDRIYYSPSHNSVITWAHSRPASLSRANIVTLDTLGHSRLMTLERWAWLIAMTDASDSQLLEWARSFPQPPSVEITGGRLDFDSYVPERRAICLTVDSPTVSMTIQPTVTCVNPVFELRGAFRHTVEHLIGAIEEMNGAQDKIELVPMFLNPVSASGRVNWIVIELDAYPDSQIGIFFP